MVGIVKYSSVTVFYRLRYLCGSQWVCQHGVHRCVCIVYTGVSASGT